MKHRVFLSGGLKTNWREEFKCLASCQCKYDGEILWIDPKKYVEYFEDEHGHRPGEELYTPFNTEGVLNSDIVVAYMERDNPSGHGLCVEVGLAFAAGIPVLFVSDLTEDDLQYQNFGMVRQMANNFTTLEKAHEALITLLWVTEVTGRRDNLKP